MRDDEDDELWAAALGALAGPSLVLDARLAIRFAAAGTEALIGAPVPLGGSAAAYLCGDRPKRPVAEALASGTPMQAVIPGVGGGGAAYLRVRSQPIERGRKRLGWVVYLAAADDVAEASGPELFHGMWSADPAMKRLFRVIEKVAQDDAPVLVRGESGAGKELVAAALHAASPRARGPFRAINCAALPPNLLESELFGHARGAFTGAVRAMKGHVELAHRGTLFLDEVAEVPLELQAKLLRVLETGEVLPVGAREPVAVNVRVVSATHRALRQEVEAGRFRADLMYRLRVIPLFLPPLRERVRDVALLVERFVAEMSASKRRRIDTVNPAALRALERYEWPGNVRELRNALAYAFAIGDGPRLELADLPPEIADEALGPLTDMSATTAAEPGPGDERRRIERALERSGGHRERAAQLLGWSRVTLWRRMRALGL